ncbi:MAG: peptide deformylase [Phycisphaerae bacterium]|nr:peptide deformylase [Phycisphaerae bacterium]
MVTSSLPTRIIEYPDPRLRRKAARVEVFDGKLEALVKRMLELMHEERGVGLAAPQVGVSRRLFVYNPTGEPQDDAVLVNPELADLTELIEAEEGCLSVPDVRVSIRRARRCKLRGQDLSGRCVELAGEGLVARIWQHEIDHLDGKLIVDRMDGADKIANKKAIGDLESRYRRASAKR